MTPLQQQLQIAQRMINAGLPHNEIAQALARILTDEYGIEEGEFRRVCRNTGHLPEHFNNDPIIEFNDEQPWHNINLEMES